MKTFFSIAAILATLSFSPAASAGGAGSCHFHGNTPAKESVVVDCAKKQIDELVAKTKIEASWKSVPLDKALVVEGKNKKEWKLTFVNPQATDVNKRTLYLFYTLSGNFIAANFTGQ
jgi:hypothetical protein